MSAVSEEERLRRARIPAVLDYAFRPMFLAAGSWAVIAFALWLAMFFGYMQLPTRFDPLAWHVGILPLYLPLAHPSPRNQPWLVKNPWFERELVQDLWNVIQALNL